MSVPRKLTQDDLDEWEALAGNDRVFVVASSRLAYVEQRLAEAERLLGLFTSHYSSEDGFYSCAEAEGAFGHEGGAHADELQAEVDRLAADVQEAHEIIESASAAFGNATALDDCYTLAEKAAKCMSTIRQKERENRTLAAAVQRLTAERDRAREIARTCYEAAINPDADIDDADSQEIASWPTT